MHQPNNTLGGRYGFVAVYDGGLVMTEFDFVWDDLPLDKPIKILRMVDAVDDNILFELTGFPTYFFSNEAVSGWTNNMKIGGPSTLTIPENNFNLTAKLFGTFDRHHGVHEIRVDLTGPTPVAQKREYTVRDCPFAPHACRPGVVV